MKGILILLIFCNFIYEESLAISIKAGNPAKFNETIKTLNPGDSVILANGIWKDAGLIFSGKVQKAQSTGQEILVAP